MKSIRVLVPFWGDPNSGGKLPLAIRNIVTELRKHTEVEICWLIYQPEKFNPSKNISNETIIDIHSYKNVKNILTHQKPTFVIASPSYNFIDLATTYAANFLNIPVISGFGIQLNSNEIKHKSILKTLFSDSVSTDKHHQGKLLRKGKFIIFKLNFLFNTLISIKYSYIKIIRLFITLIQTYYSDQSLLYNKEFLTDLAWIPNKDFLNFLLKKGLPKEKLVLTGFPAYDNYFTKRKISYKPTNHKNKLSILFAPGPMHEHGLVSKQKQHMAIKDIINEISNHSNLDLKIKIHPSSSIFSEYQEIIDSTNSKIPLFSKGDILDYLTSSDLVITTSGTSVTLDALIFNKPVLIYNFNNVYDDIFIQNGLVLECKNTSDIVNQITEAIKHANTIEIKKEEFLKEFFYKLDGLASYRISNAILDLIKNRLKII